jgi:hypothetical protein
MSMEGRDDHFESRAGVWPLGVAKRQCGWGEELSRKGPASKLVLVLGRGDKFKPWEMRTTA